MLKSRAEEDMPNHASNTFTLALTPEQAGTLEAEIMASLAYLRLKVAPSPKRNRAIRHL